MAAGVVWRCPKCKVLKDPGSKDPLRCVRVPRLTIFTYFNFGKICCVCALDGGWPNFIFNQQACARCLEKNRSRQLVGGLESESTPPSRGGCADPVKSASISSLSVRS